QENHPERLPDPAPERQHARGKEPCRRSAVEAKHESHGRDRGGQERSARPCAFRVRDRADTEHARADERESFKGHSRRSRGARPRPTPGTPGAEAPIAAPTTNTPTARPTVRRMPILSTTTELPALPRIEPTAYAVEAHA